MDAEPKAMVALTHDAYDTLVRDGRLEERGRRMVEDYRPYNLVRVFCGDRTPRLACVTAFERPPSKKDLVVNWTIELIEGSVPCNRP